MASVIRRARSTLARWATWLACLLVWQAAMPVLAVAAARAQGQPLVEVCTVYGVRLIAPAAGNDDSQDPAPDSGFWSDACPLSVLVLAPPSAPLTQAAPPAWPGEYRLHSCSTQALDRVRAWMAGRQQGPPAA